MKQCQQLQANELDESFTGAPSLPQRLLAICDISADLNVCWPYLSFHVASYLVTRVQLSSCHGIHLLIPHLLFTMLILENLTPTR